MDYPKSLLPRHHFKKIADISKIEKGSFIHFTSSKKNQDQDGKLKPEFVVRNQSKELRHYSNNLLGAFEVKHIFVEINSKSGNGYFIGLWEERSDVKKSEFEKDFTVDKSRGYFFLKIKDCLDAKVPYKSDLNGEVSCNVLHTPTNSNFWHISLRWVYNGEDIEYWKEKEKGALKERFYLLQGRLLYIMPSLRSLSIPNGMKQSLPKEWEYKLYP